MRSRFRSAEELAERIKRALINDGESEGEEHSTDSVERFEFSQPIEQLEDPMMITDRAVSEHPPIAVTHALEAGFWLDQEETTGEVSGDRRNEAFARLHLLGIGDPDSYIAKHGKTLELRLKILEMQKKREQLAEFEAVHLATGNSSEIASDSLENMRVEYEKARAEYVGESVLRMTRERTRLTDAVAEKRIEEKGWGSEIYNLWKKFGDMNLERLGWKPQGRAGKFVARFASVRSAVSFGLLGAGFALGAGSAAGITALALRRSLGGLGAGIGSYDLMNFGSEKWAELKGWRREVDKDEALEMDWEDITKRLEYFEAAARLHGKKVSDMPGYTTLLQEYRLRLEQAIREVEARDGESISLWLKEKSDEADMEIDYRVSRMKMSNRNKKLIATGIGVCIGSGLFAKVVGVSIGRVREALFGSADPPPDIARVKLVAQGNDGERVSVSPQGQIDYAPPVPEEEVGEISPEISPPEAPTEPPTPSQETLVTATTGDNSWKMVARALHNRYGARFDTLDSARKSWIIDLLNKQIEKDPRIFGIRGTRLIRSGDTIDFSKLFNDSSRMERVFDATEGLSEEKVESITRHQSVVRDWLRAHPEVKLRHGDIDRVIQGKLDEAMYEGETVSGTSVGVRMDIIPENGAGEIVEASPTPQASVTADELGLTFAPPYTHEEQEAIAQYIKYHEDAVRIYKEKIKLLEEKFGMRQEFSEVRSLAENRIEDLQAAIETHRSSITKPHLYNDWRGFALKEYTPEVDVDAELREFLLERELITPDQISVDIYPDATGVQYQAVHDAFQYAREIGVTPPSLMIEAGGIVRTPTGEIMARFSYDMSGLPKNVEWSIKPDPARAVVFLPHGWQDAVPSVKERYELFQKAIDLEKAEHAFRELKRAGLQNTEEAKFVDRFIRGTKEALEQRFRIPSEAVVEPVGTAVPRGPVAETGHRVAHEEAMGELEAASRSAERFVNVKLSLGERMDALRELIGEDGRATEYNGVKYEARGDRIFFEIERSGAREVTPDKLDALAEYSRLGELVMTLPEAELEQRIADIMRRLYETR